METWVGCQLVSLDELRWTVAKNVAVNIPHTLATLHARLRALEMESSVSRRRLKELEAEVEKANQEMDFARRNGEKETRKSENEKSGKLSLVPSTIVEDC